MAEDNKAKKSRVAMYLVVTALLVWIAGKLSIEYWYLFSSMDELIDETLRMGPEELRATVELLAYGFVGATALLLLLALAGLVFTVLREAKRVAPSTETSESR